MKKLLVLLVFASCTKEYKYTPVMPADKIEDTTFSITMDRCPNSSLTCFWVNYPNYKDTVKIEVSWMFGNNSFREILVITQRNQLIYTKSLFYGVVPFKY